VKSVVDPDPGRADVSVVIPVFNSGASAIAAIDSVRSQTLKVREIIVVDDGSTDGSAALIAQAYQLGDGLVKLYRIDNSGAAGARNFGIRQAVSSFIAFLDSDDLWLPGKLERQMAVLSASAAVGLVGTRTTMSATVVDCLVDQLPARITVSSRLLLFKNFFQTSTVVARRSVMDSVGLFPNGQRYAEEGDFFMRIAARSTCVLLNEVLVDYGGSKAGFGEAGLSANLIEMQRGELRNIRRARQRRDCSLPVYLAAVAFSLLKFARRALVRGLRWRR
jgi:glycosyltransferase involved in cell wall biosynthesis